MDDSEEMKEEKGKTNEINNEKKEVHNINR